jgi:hypothetical protein
MFFDAKQLYVSTLVVFVAFAIAAVLVFVKGRDAKRLRRDAYTLTCVCALTALASWARFGEFHYTVMDTDASQFAGSRPKAVVHQPLHFHEFFHYYLGAKYFSELGYSGLYDCTTLADAEIAQDEHVGPRIVTRWVRDLDDVLRDNPRDVAIARCRDVQRPRFTAARWAAFSADLRELHRLVPDEWWNDVVYDAGFNPPPSWVVLGSAVANVIPIRGAGLRTYLVATSLDVLLLVLCFFALRRAFGKVAAVTAVVFFGASFIAAYGWNGGAFLRFTWITATVLALAAMKEGRWALAGACFAAAACDRVFPVGFAVGAVLPLAVRAVEPGDARRALARFGFWFAGTTALLVLVSVGVFGATPWRVFFARIVHHGDIYYTMHIGLKKVLTWRDWVPSQNFMGHDGLIVFREWNLHLRRTWTEMRWLAVPLQLVGIGAAMLAGARRRSHEAAILVGAAFMFLFNMPANYYFAILAVVPALLLRAAATAPSTTRRLREYALFTAFVAWWLGTFAASRYSGDVLVYNHLICASFAVFLLMWIGGWLTTPTRLRGLRFARGGWRSVAAPPPREG